MERSTSSERGLVWQLLVLVQSAAEAGDFFIGSPSQPHSHRLSNLYSECRNQALSLGTAIRPASLYSPSRKGGNGARTASFHVADFDRGLLPLLTNGKKNEKNPAAEKPNSFAWRVAVYLHGRNRPVAS